MLHSRFLRLHPSFCYPQQHSLATPLHQPHRSTPSERKYKKVCEAIAMSHLDKPAEFTDVQYQGYLHHTLPLDNYSKKYEP